jgi:hypothetical protein
MKRHLRSIVTVAALVALSTVGGDRAYSQAVQDQQGLRRQIERRFEVLPLRNGVALRPRDAGRGVRSIEISDGTISIDGTPVTGAELRDKLGADADLVLQLSYLETETRQRLFGGSLTPPEPPRLPEPPEPPRPERRRPRRDGGDRVRFGGNVTVEEGEVVQGDVVAIGGSVRVDGQVTGDVVAIGGALELGPRAEVDGDAVAIGGGLKRDPGASVGGEIVDVGAGAFPFGGRFPPFQFGPLFPFFGVASRVVSLMSTLARLMVLCVLASIVLLVGREYVDRVGLRAATEPVKAGAIGLISQLLFLPLLVLTIVILVITIIGIPLLVLIPFALLALAVIALVGFTAVVSNLGQLINRRFGWTERGPYMTAITGIVLLLSPVLIARLLGLASFLTFPVTGPLLFLGFLLEYLVWTVGFGAVALLRFGRTPPLATPAAA